MDYTRDYFDAWYKGQKELIDGFQENIRSLNAESFKNFVNPYQYKALIDTIFGFNPDADKLLLNQTSQLIELYSGSGQQFTKPWAEAAKTGLEAFPQFAEGHPESFIKIFNSMFDAFDNTFGRIFHVPPVGRDREKIELLLRCLMEMYLSDLPIVLRHEMDDLNKTVFELEKKLKRLEKQIRDSTVWRSDVSSSAHHEDCNQPKMLPFDR